MRSQSVFAVEIKQEKSIWFPLPSPGLAWPDSSKVISQCFHFLARLGSAHLRPGVEWRGEPFRPGLDQEAGRVFSIRILFRDIGLM